MPASVSSLASRTVVREYQYRGESEAPELWRASLGAVWPLRARAFMATTGGRAPCVRVVAEREGELVGFAAARVQGQHAALIVVLVHPSLQGRGIGTRLIKELDGLLQGRGVCEITLGAGAGAYFWPGVPEHLTRANKFFDSRGWTRQEACMDLLGDIRGFSAPARVMAHAERADVSFALATASDAAAVLRLQDQFFPSWREGYLRALAGSEGVLVGHADGRIIAACTLEDNNEHYLFPALIPGSYGAIGCVGVAPQARSHGVGLALVAAASETLAERGVDQCFIGYTHLGGWYAQLGYQPWRSYRMGTRALAPTS